MPAVSATAVHWGQGRRLSVTLLAACMAALLMLSQAAATARAADPTDPPANPPSSTTLTPDEQRVENVILAAKQYLGVPYRVGSEGPTLFDCSGLVFRAFSDADLVDRIGGARLRAAGYMRWFAGRGLMTTDESQAQRGDLVIYNGGSHIGIYLGDGRVISALINPFGVTVHSLHGVNEPVTGFLRPDWSGKGDVPPFVPITNLPDVPEAPVSLVPGADWMPSLDPAISAPQEREGKEVVALRTLNSRTFANNDGSYTTEFHAQPIFYQPSDTTDPADLRPVDLTFATDKKSGFASVSSSPVVLTTRPANDDAGFVTATSGGSSVSLSLATDAGMQSSESVPTILEGGRVVDYFDLQPQQVGLRVLAQTDGFKSFVVLNKVPDRNRFSFVLNAPGLTPRLADDGSIALVNEGGTTVGRLPSPLLLDSSDIDGSGGGVFTSAASWSVDTSGGAPVITAAINRDFLDEAVMPAYLDVSLVDFAQAAASADVTFVSSSHPNAALAGFQRPESAGWDELWLGRQPNTHYDNDALVRFNGLTSLLGTVDVASASLEVLPYFQHTEDGVTLVQRITSDWNASTATWATQPSVDNSDTATSTSNGGSWTSIDVSAYVTDLLSHGATDYGLMLSGNDSGAATWKRLAASDAGDRAEFGPRLLVTWSGLRPTAQAVAPAASDAPTTLSWTAPSMARAQVRFQIQVSHDGFATIDVDSGTVKGKPGKLNAWALPADSTLVGGTYEWRVRAKYNTDSAWSPWSNSMSVDAPAAMEHIYTESPGVPHGAAPVV